MDFSPQQQRAVGKVGRWMREKSQPVFNLAGYAGSGKTTLAKYLASTCDGRVAFAAYTGKAAQVLRQKGCGDAQTIHKLIYNVSDKSTAKLRDLEKKLADLPKEGYEDSKRRLRDAIATEKRRLTDPSFSMKSRLELDYEMIVVDESSMIDFRMGEDLLSLGVPILALGDPAQLPPVKGKPFFGSMPVDFMITEIHRQARDNPIIRMSMDIREGRSLKTGSYGDSLVICDPSDEERLHHATSVDQIICGRNSTRTGGNQRMRQILGHTGPFPRKGERLVCGKNNHKEGLLNGQIWIVDEPGYTNDFSYSFVGHQDGSRHKQDVETHACYFLGTQDNFDWRDLRNSNRFDYGYLLTAHKAQGSQWDSVLVFDESEISRGTRMNWLYTAVTRAAERVVVFQ